MNRNPASEFLRLTELGAGDYLHDTAPVNPGVLTKPTDNLMKVRVSSYCFLCMGMLVPPLSAADLALPADVMAEARAVHHERLQKYAFDSDKPDDKAPGLLLGNTLLGGCLAASGLGIPTLWGAELWLNTDQRLPLKGPMMSCGDFAGLERISYRQRLSLADGLAQTSVRYTGNGGYDAEVFCSMAEPTLWVIRVTSRGDHERDWRLNMTENTRQVSSNSLKGISAFDVLTPCSWSVHADKPFTGGGDKGFILRLAPDESVTLVCRLNAWADDGLVWVEETGKFDRLLSRHRAAWDSLWQRCAVLALPDADIERLWYRSLYWTLSTCGNNHYSPGESMFCGTCWDMHPFTYGAAGWAAQAFTAVGLPERAKAMLDCHFKPAALRDNAKVYTKTLTGGTASQDAMAFAHEVKTDGRNIPCGQYELQRHLDGFAAALFHRHQRYYPNQSLAPADLYQLMKGLAQFWCGLAHRDAQSGEWLLPEMTSLTEDLIAIHPIDAALAAKWCLTIAARDAAALGCDADLAKHWREVADQLAMPQNDERYLEFAGDPDKRSGGGYQGVRGFVYLGWPTIELMPGLDRAKALRTLDHTWERNRKGEGMIGFVANWFALADIQYGRGDHALEILKHNFRCEDAWKQGVSEFPGATKYYFTTNYASYLLVPLAMAVRSADDQLETFGAVPAAWKDFAFYQVPAESDLRVSGVMRDGKVRWVRYMRGGKVLRQSAARESLVIRHGADGSPSLEPANFGVR